MKASPLRRRRGTRWSDDSAARSGLNLRAQLLVALVLAVAACYEAVEVILMSGL